MIITFKPDGYGFILPLSAKRRRALLASNPIKE
jgi:hypothetical protein